jgi:ABC-type protease/lipase transport system fused ATPase/permease subunit
MESKHYFYTAGGGFAVFVVALILSIITGGFFLFIMFAVVAFLVCVIFFILYLWNQRSVNRPSAPVRSSGIASRYFSRASSRAATTGGYGLGERIAQWLDTMQQRREEARYRRELRRREMMERRVAAIQPVQVSPHSFGHEMV